MRVLLVEDAVELAEALKQGLVQNGYEVDLVSDGEAALECIRSDSYAVVVLDRMLPRLDGLTVCRTIRKEGLLTAILMLTARDSIEDRVEGLDAGADDYLVKPFALAELLARVKALLRRGPPTPSRILRAGNVVLDLETGAVTCGTRVLQLSAKEVLILSALMQRAGRLLPHAQLREKAWDDEGLPTPEVLRAHIKNLRRKIELPGEKRLIETVHGIGYRFVP